MMIEFNMQRFDLSNGGDPDPVIDGPQRHTEQDPYLSFYLDVTNTETPNNVHELGCLVMRRTEEKSGWYKFVTDDGKELARVVFGADQQHLPQLRALLSDVLTPERLARIPSAPVAVAVRLVARMPAGMDEGIGRAATACFSTRRIT